MPGEEFVEIVNTANDGDSPFLAAFAWAVLAALLVWIVAELLRRQAETLKNAPQSE